MNGGVAAGGFGPANAGPLGTCFRVIAAFDGFCLYVRGYR